MKCKSPECNNESLIGFTYCSKHLCKKTKRDGTNCKLKKFKGKKFCFLHSKYLYGKISFWGLITAIFGIIITLIVIFFGNQIQSLIGGHLYIDFKENPEDFYYIEEKPYVKIEVLNELGYPLLNVNGTVTLTCENKLHQITSKTFKLEEGGEFLPSKKKDYLIAYDKLFVDLINTRADSCSDASYVVGKYRAINGTHAELIEIKSHEFFNDREPIQIDYNIGESIQSDSCLRCNITTEIYASNTNKKLSETEIHKFIGLHTIISPLKEVILYSDMTEEFYQSYAGVLQSFTLCKGITEGECGVLLCNEVNKYFKLDMNCKESKGMGGVSLPNCGTAVIEPISSCI